MEGPFLVKREGFYYLYLACTILVKLFLSRPETSLISPNFGSVLVSGNGTPKISGKSRLVKYYNLARSVWSCESEFL